ncbi:MAG: 3-phosphoshikimate 1-carboxyvinyltransferase [Lysobacterales bacterium]
MSDREPIDWLLTAGGPLRGCLRVPGDKSISHRAIMLASIAEGESRIKGFLEGEDTLATAAAFRAMGIAITAPAEGERIVQGRGLNGLSAPSADIDCGNAGTAMRLLAGLLAGQRFDSVLCGDASLSRRPMRRVIEPLSLMGARILAEPGGLPPLSIRGRAGLHGIHYALPVASAQVKSAILLAGLYADGQTTVSEPHPTRDYTESMLSAFGVQIERDGETASLRGGQSLQGRVIDVPADFSSAAFFLVAASLVPGSDLLIEAVGINPRRTGLLDTLIEMGADIRVGQRRQLGGEWVADLHVRSAPLRGISVPAARVPDMIDEFPALFVAAALAEGETRVSGAAELRVKESDRIGVMATALKALGAEIAETADGALICGVGRLSGGQADSAGDHRCAMAMAVAALRANAPVRVRDVANVATSFPGFERLAADIGFALQVLPGEHG